MVKKKSFTTNDDLSLDVPTSDVTLLDIEGNDSGLNSDGAMNLSDDEFDGMYGDDERVMDKHQELLKGLTDFDPYLQTKFTQWCGQYWDEHSRSFMIDKNIKPILNQRGAMFYISYLRTYVRDNNIITVLPPEIFKYCMQDIIDTVFNSISQYYDEFKIGSVADQKRLWSEIENSAQLILSGSVGGKYNDFIGGTYRAGFQDNAGMGGGGNMGRFGMAAPPRKKGLINKIKSVFT